jgi:hypothetical protein
MSRSLAVCRERNPCPVCQGVRATVDWIEGGGGAKYVYNFSNENTSNDTTAVLVDVQMKRPLSLRTLLVLLAMTAVAPGIGVLVYLSVVVQRDEIVQARQELESVAKLVAANQEQLIEGVRQILVTIASGPSVRRYDLHDLCVEFLRNVQAATPAYTNIGVLNMQGRIECQGHAGDANGDASGRQYFRNAIESGKFSVGTYMVGISSGRKAVGFGIPVYDYAGKLRGVAFAGLDLEYANHSSSRSGYPGIC